MYLRAYAALVDRAGFGVVAAMIASVSHVATLIVIGALAFVVLFDNIRRAKASRVS